MEYSEDTLAKVKEAVAVVMRRDMADHEPDQELSLDSINRITLIAELENKFSMEILLEDMQPEMFSSLAAISDFVEGSRR